MILPIDKSVMPYGIKIEIAGFDYRMDFFYNADADTFTVNLYFQEEPVIMGEPILINNPLFYDFSYLPIPIVPIMPLSNGEEVERVGWQEFGESVQLYLVGGDDIGVTITAEN